MCVEIPFITVYEDTIMILLLLYYDTVVIIILRRNETCVDGFDGSLLKRVSCSPVLLELHLLVPGTIGWQDDIIIRVA